MMRQNDWPAGPWDDEPDELQWTAHGLECFLRRHPRIGHLCGYVGLPKTHPLYDSREENQEHLDVHGGVTFGGPLHGKDDGLWYIGFDCAHAGDVCPVMLNFRERRGWVSDDEEYRTVAYVKSETENLARQLAEST